jgi:hypothetical protein
MNIQNPQQIVGLMAAGYDATVIVAVGQQEQVSHSCQQHNLTSIKRPGGRCQTLLQLDLGTLTEREQRQKRLGPAAPGGAGR